MRLSLMLGLQYKLPWRSFTVGSRPLMIPAGGQTRFKAATLRQIYKLQNGGEPNLNFNILME